MLVVSLRDGVELTDGGWKCMTLKLLQIIPDFLDDPKVKRLVV